MNNLKNAAVGVCPLKLSERLKKVRLDVIEPPDQPRVGSTPYKQIVAEMLEKAQKNDRDFLKDIFDLILMYIVYGNNIEKILDKRSVSKEQKEKLSKLMKVYDLQSNGPFFDRLPTLSKITAAFSHVSLVLTDMLIAVPDGPQPNIWVTDFELGASVHHHFKMSYFPGLIHLDEFSFKAQVGLLLFNLCNAKAISKTSPERTIEAAFVISCQTSAGIIKERMSPLKARKLFTKSIEAMDFDSTMLYNVWNSVIGENKIPLIERTRLTHFHEKVLKAQPLDHQTWCQLLDTQN